MDKAQILQELYDIVGQYDREEYERVLAEKLSYPYLYHLSPIRQNLIDWIPMNKKQRVLECNAECGALTGVLLKKAGTVTCVTTDELCASIIKLRYRACGEQLTVIEQKDFHEDEIKYDLILLVGSFFRYRKELKKLHGMLAAGGRLVLADANRLGLKYFAGCKEEYQGVYFSGVEGYAEDVSQKEVPRCYSKSEYAGLLREADFKELTFYYPYPDYKFPHTIYSDKRLPTQGELGDNRRNYAEDRLQLFEEQKVYDSLLKEGVFDIFSNSYLVEAYA